MIFLKYIFIFSALYFPASGKIAAQKFPVYHSDSIRLLVNNLGGKSQYSNLLLRLQGNDTTLALADYFLIYHGLPFQENYNPYASHQKLMDSFNEQSYPNSVAEADRLLEENPANLDALYFGFLSCKQMHKFAVAEKYATRYWLFLESIMASGDGKTEKTAFHVNTVGDEFQVLNYLKLKKEKQELVQKKNGKIFDRFEVKPSDNYKERKIYFDISFAFSKLSQAIAK